MEKQIFKVYSQELAEELMKALKGLDAAKKEPDESNGTFKVVMTKEITDRDGEIVKIDGLDISNFQKNPVLLFGHNFYSLPIGKITSIRRIEDELIAEGVFSSIPQAQEVRTLYDEGILKTVSIGFMPKERDPNNRNIITSSELLELSFVAIPSNTGAMTTDKQAKIDGLVKFFNAKNEKAFEKADKAQDWSPSDSLKIADKEGFFVAYSQADKKHKLPCAAVIDGKEVYVWKAIESSMHDLLSDKGVLSLSEEEKVNAYKKLATLYELFDEEAPKFLSYTDIEVRALFPDMYPQATEKSECSHCAEFKAGRVLSAKSRAKVVAAVNVLNELLELTEPDVDKQKIAEENIKSLQSIQKVLEKAIIGSKKII